MAFDRKEKWRPTLSMIVAVLLASILLLPLAGIIFFRLYENHLVRSTEAELIAQTAAIAASMAAKLSEGDVADLPLGARLPDRNLSETEWRPVLPQLDLATTTILPERQDARDASSGIHPAYRNIRAFLDPILRRTQQATLAGFRILDVNGTVIAGRSEIGRSLVHVAEVRAGLTGSYASVLRRRTIDNPQPIYSISRGTDVRIFVAMPVVVLNRVAGVVYGARTPSNILKELYLQRGKIAVAAAFVLAVAFIIGLVFTRAISLPIRELTERTKKIGRGERRSVRPLKRHGSRELHELANGLLDMSEKLFERNDYINTFATHVSHELKSPLTSIRGAVELLFDDDRTMSDVERRKFLGNILKDTERATRLLEKLRALAKADNLEIAGSCDLSGVVAELGRRFETLQLHCPETLAIPLSAESARIVLENLLDNSVRHGARTVTVSASEEAGRITLVVADDGSGISDANAANIFDLFFTTRRDDGGTGMGLGIVRAVLRAHRGEIGLLPGRDGARFEIVLRLPNG